MKLVFALSALVISAALAGCAMTRVAQTKTVESQGERFDIGGAFEPSSYDLTVTINGEPVLRGTFSPYMPFLLLASKYKDPTVSARCYFGSILSSKAGAAGAIASSIQGAIGKSSDQCDLTLGEARETLFF